LENLFFFFNKTMSAALTARKHYIEAREAYYNEAKKFWLWICEQKCELSAADVYTKEVAMKTDETFFGIGMEDVGGASDFFGRNNGELFDFVTSPKQSFVLPQFAHFVESAGPFGRRDDDWHPDMHLFLQTLPMNNTLQEVSICLDSYGGRKKQGRAKLRNKVALMMSEHLIVLQKRYDSTRTK
jgi:hypothetical protein